MKSTIARSLRGKAKYAIPIAAIFASLMLLVVLAPAEKQIAAYNPYTVTYSYKIEESGLSSEISSWTGVLNGGAHTLAPGGSY